MSRRLWLAVAGGLLVLAMGIYLAAVVSTGVGDACESPMVEREAITSRDESSHWPPRARCTFTTANSQTVVVEESWPWVAWTVPGLVSVAVLIAVASLTTRSRRNP